MSRRAQLKHGLLDVSFFSKAPIRALKGRFGRLSQLCLVEIYLCMSGATFGVIDSDALESIIADHEIPSPDLFKAYLLEKKLIHVELDGYSNTRVIKDQESCARKNKCGDELPPDSAGNLRKEGGISGEKSRIPDNEGDNDIVFDINLKELDTPEIRRALDLYGRRITGNGGTFDEIAREALLMPYAGRPDDLLEMLLNTASLGRAKRQVQPFRNRDGPKTGIDKHQSAVQAGLDLIAKFEREENEQERDG